MRKIIFFSLLISVIIISGSNAVKAGGLLNLKLSSEAFKDGYTIDEKYSCKNGDTSPDISWSSSMNAKSYALVFYDQNGRLGNKDILWFVYYIPADIIALNAGLDGNPPVIQGFNSFKKEGYNAPCPKDQNIHIYNLTVYALDIKLPYKRRFTEAQFQKEIKEHTIASGNIRVLYSNKGK